MGWRIERTYFALAGIFLCLNLLDFVTTAFGVISGRGVETNTMFNWLGGPLSITSIVVKLILGPLVVLLPAFWFMKRFQDIRPALGLLAPSAAMFGYAAVNNLLVCIAGKKYCPHCGKEVAEPKEDGT